MESDHHFSSNPDCSHTADVFSFTGHTALGAISLVSDRWGVAVRWFHDNSSQSFPNSNASESFLWITFGFCDGCRNCRKLFSVLLWSFGFTRIRLYPLSAEILYHDCVSMMVSGFTSFVEDFVISCNSITKLFCSWNRSLIACSARNPRNFGSQTSVANSVFGEVSINTVLPFLCHHFWSIAFRIWVHSFRGMCEHIHLHVLEINC